MQNVNFFLGYIMIDKINFDLETSIASSYRKILAYVAGHVQMRQFPNCNHRILEPKRKIHV
jgi:hypothetical protein